MRFSEILTLVTFSAGCIWAFDVIFLKRIRKKSNVIGLKQEPKIVEYARSFFPVLLLVFILRTFLVEPFQIPSGSMKPTLLEGDFILVNKFNYGLRIPLLNIKMLAFGVPKRGDIVVFRHANGKDLIKRVVGIPGDHIHYKNKILYINDVAASQEFQRNTLDMSINGMVWQVAEKIEQLGHFKHPIFVQNATDPALQYHHAETHVPENAYYVMGDNRDNSEDSRYFGVIQDKDLIGRAFFIWMSWDSKEKNIRWNRLGNLF